MVRLSAFISWQITDEKMAADSSSTAIFYHTVGSVIDSLSAAVNSLGLFLLRRGLWEYPVDTDHVVYKFLIKTLDQNRFLCLLQKDGQKPPEEDGDHVHVNISGDEKGTGADKRIPV